MNKILIISTAVLCYACDPGYGCMTGRMEAEFYARLLDDDASVKKVETKAFTVSVPEEAECELDSAKMQKGIISLSVHTEGKEYRVKYIPFGVRHEFLVQLESNKRSSHIANDTVTMIEGRQFNTYTFNNDSTTERIHTWENGDCSMCIYEKRKEQSVSGGYDLLGNIQILVPEAGTLSIAERVDAWNKILNDENLNVRFCLNGKKFIFQDNTENTHRYYGEPRRTGARDLSELIGSLSLFHECAMQGYTFNLQLRDSEGRILLNESYSAKELLDYE